MDVKHNLQFIERMELLGLSYEDRNILFLVPSVVVAWADGTADSAELKTIADRYCGHEGRDGDHGFLPTTKAGREFLTKKFIYQYPDCGLVENCVDLLKMVVESLPPKDLNKALKFIRKTCEDVAESSGGFLGLFNKIGEEEKAVMQSMLAKFTVVD